MPIQGIDISEYNAVTDWNLVKSSGVQFAMIRASKGTSYVDKNFSENVKNAHGVGIYPGAYHYCVATNVDEALEEANHFVNTIRGHELFYPVALDIEDESQENLSREVLTDIAIVFLNTVAYSGYYPMIYSTIDWFANRLDDARLLRFDHWIAEWYNLNTYPGFTGIWQYSSTGSIDGIVGNVDLDYSYIDYATLIKSSGFNNLTRFNNLNPHLKDKRYYPGYPIFLKNAPIYATYDSKRIKNSISGKYYLYDAIAFVNESKNARYRITKSIENIDKGIKYVMGSVNEDDFMDR